MKPHPHVPTAADVLLAPAPADVVPPRGRRRLTGSFITRSGHVEPAIGTSPVPLDEEAGQSWVSPKGVFGLNTFSESEALVQLHRCLAETGQLAVRSADALLDLWFAGIGDADNLFVEFVPRGRPADDHSEIRCGLCALHEAETLLRDIYQGAGSQELITSWFVGSQKSRIQQGDTAQLADMTTAEGGPRHLTEQ